MAIHPRRASGDAIASRLAHDDPFGLTFVDDGRNTVAVLTCNEGAHALIEVPSDGPALALYLGQLQETAGFHVVLVADEATTKTEGNVYGMFRVRHAGRAASPHAASCWPHETAREVAPLPMIDLRDRPKDAILEALR